MRTRFVANFQGTRDRPPAVSDMRRIKQQPGETLQKYIQHFNNARLKIPKLTEEAIISAFSDGVRGVKMKEELAMHEDLCTSLELRTRFIANFQGTRDRPPAVSNMRRIKQ